VFPQAFDGACVLLEGHTIEIVAAQGLESRRYLWVPSLHVVFGGVLVFCGLHVWTADNATPRSRAAGIKNLQAIAARQPPWSSLATWPSMLRSTFRPSTARECNW
jgi:hypothetical protein